MSGVALLAALSGAVAAVPASRAAAVHAARTAAAPERDRNAGGFALVLPAPVWILVGAITGGAVGLRFAHDSLLPAYLLFAIGAVLLSAVDLAAWRIPNKMLAAVVLTAALYMVVLGLATADTASVERASLAAAAFGAFFLFIALLAGGQFGLGDVKLISLVAFVLGYQSWTAAEQGIMLGILLNVAIGLFLKATYGVRSMPLAPCLLAGALVVLMA